MTRRLRAGIAPRVAVGEVEADVADAGAGTRGQHEVLVRGSQLRDRRHRRRYATRTSGASSSSSDEVISCGEPITRTPASFATPRAKGWSSRDAARNTGRPWLSERCDWQRAP